MDIFDLSIEEFEKEMKKLVNEFTPEELLQQLKECGYQQEDECSIVSAAVKSEKYVLSEEMEIDNECIDFSPVHSKENEKWGLVA